MPRQAFGFKDARGIWGWEIAKMWIQRRMGNSDARHKDEDQTRSATNGMVVRESETAEKKDFQKVNNEIEKIKKGEAKTGDNLVPIKEPSVKEEIDGEILAS
jgi:hypothetical protein